MSSASPWSVLLSDVSIFYMLTFQFFSYLPVRTFLPNSINTFQIVCEMYTIKPRVSISYSSPLRLIPLLWGQLGNILCSLANDYFMANESVSLFGINRAKSQALVGLVFFQYLFIHGSS